MIHSRMTKKEIQAEIYRLELILASCQLDYNIHIFGGKTSKPLSELDNLTFVTQMALNECREKMLLR